MALSRPSPTMTLRITQIVPGPPAEFTLDGRLTGAEVAELCRAVADTAGPVVLDLTGLQFADRAGASALRELIADGVKLTGVSPYIELLIGDARAGAAN